MSSISQTIPTTMTTVSTKLFFNFNNKNNNHKRPSSSSISCLLRFGCTFFFFIIRSSNHNYRFRWIFMSMMIMMIIVGILVPMSVTAKIDIITGIKQQQQMINNDNQTMNTISTHNTTSKSIKYSILLDEKINNDSKRQTDNYDDENLDDNVPNHQHHHHHHQMNGSLSQISSSQFLLMDRNKRNSLFGRKRSNIINGGFLGKNIYNNSLWQHYLEPWTANPNYWIVDRYHDNVVCLLAAFSGTIRVRPANATFHGGTFLVSPEESLGRRANCERNSRNIFWKFSQHDEREVVIEDESEANDDGGGDIVDDLDEDDDGESVIDLTGTSSSSDEDHDQQPQDPIVSGITPVFGDVNLPSKTLIQGDIKNGQKRSKVASTTMTIANSRTFIERSNRLLSAGFHVVGSVIEFHVAYIECLQVADKDSVTNQYQMRDNDVCTNLSVSFDLGSFGNPQSYECNHIWSKTLKDVHYNQNKRRYAGEVQISLKWIRIDKDPLGVAPYSFRRARRKCVWDTILSWQSLTIIGSSLLLFIIGFFGLCVCSNSSCHDETGEWTSNWCCYSCCRRSSGFRSSSRTSPRIVQYTPSSNRFECNYHQHHRHHRGLPPPPPPPSSSTSLLTNTSSHPNHLSCGHRKPTFSNSYSYEGTGSNPTQQSSSSAMSTAIDDYYYYYYREKTTEKTISVSSNNNSTSTSVCFLTELHNQTSLTYNSNNGYVFNLEEKWNNKINNDSRIRGVKIFKNLICDQHNNHNSHLVIDVDSNNKLPSSSTHYHPFASSSSMVFVDDQQQQTFKHGNISDIEKTKATMDSWTTLCFFFVEFMTTVRFIMLNFLHMKHVLDRLTMLGLTTLLSITATTTTTSTMTNKTKDRTNQKAQTAMMTTLDSVQMEY